MLASRGSRKAQIFVKPFAGGAREDNREALRALEKMAGVTSVDRAGGWRLSIVGQVGVVPEEESVSLTPETARKIGANLLAFRSERVQPEHLGPIPESEIGEIRLEYGPARPRALDEHGVARAARERLDAERRYCHCTIGRRYEQWGGRVPEAKPQGRPLGTLLAWLNLPCAGAGDEWAHRQAWWDVSPYSTRDTHRSHYAAIPRYSVLFGRERPIFFLQILPSRLTCAD